MNTPMRRLLPLLLMVLLGYATLGQPRIHLGASTLVNSSVVLDEGLKTDPRYDSEISYQWSPVGFSFGTDFTHGFGLQLESILNNQEQIYSIINSAKEITEGERKIDLQYLQLPLLMRFMNKSTAPTRFNFNFGPQLSILTLAKETANFEPGTYELPEGTEPPAGATDNGDGTYTITDPGGSFQTIATKQADEFKNAVFSIAGGFGLDIDISRNLYLTTYTRINYMFSDMRTEDFLTQLSSGGTVKDIFGERSTVDIGIQLGLNYMIGGVRSFL